MVGAHSCICPHVHAILAPLTDSEGRGAEGPWICVSPSLMLKNQYKTVFV